VFAAEYQSHAGVLDWRTIVAVQRGEIEIRFAGMCAGAFSLKADLARVHSAFV